MTGRLSCFISGLAIGTGVALLLAPKTGKATRKALCDTASKSQDFVLRSANDTANAIRDTVGRSVDAAVTTVQGVGKALDKGRAVFYG